jgi:glycosyltransferase involved in cell wall biosynthesis
MKIAIDVTPILPGGECGGATQLVLELLRGFGQKAIPHKFILLTAHYNDSFFHKFDSSGMERICVLKNSSDKISHKISCFFNKIKDVIFSSPSRGILKKNKISVLFCPMSAPTYREPGIPTVSVIHDLQHFWYPSFFTPQELSHRSHFYNELKKKVDYVICVSSFTKKSVVEKLNTPSERIFVIPNCVHTRFLTSSTEDTKRILNKFKLYGEKYCIYPANLWPHKNHKLLLTAFGMFTKQYTQFDLHLVLPGAKLEYSSEIEDSIKQMRLESKVHLLGYLKDEELSVLWKNAYFLIYPSLFEGFGIPLVEAMVYEKPIAAGAVTSIPEVAGDAAIYFDPRKPDEIVKSMYTIVHNKNVFNSLVDEGRIQLKRYNFETMIDQYISVFRKAEKATTLTVSGIYDDGWASDTIQIVLNSSSSQKIVLLRGFIPSHHPADNMTIRLKSSNGKSKKYTYDKTDNICIQEEISGEPGSLTIKISNSFIPKQTTTDSEDSRKLTCMLREAFILDIERGEKLYEFKYPQ